MTEPTRVRGTARERLQRILYLLPAASSEEGASLDQLAEALGVTREVVLADLQEVTEREFYHRAGSGDDLRITLQPGRVRVWTTGEFRRPPRLTPRERFALGMGLRVLAAEQSQDNRPSLLDLAQRMEKGLASVSDIEFAPQFAIEEAASTARPAGSEKQAEATQQKNESGQATGEKPTDEGIQSIRAVLSDAARSGTAVRFDYIKPNSTDPESRELEPYMLVAAAGHWYAIGRDPTPDDLRAFRLDRMLNASALERTFQRDPQFDLDAYLTGSSVYRAFSTHSASARVRYTPSIARWILEREDAEAHGDGSAVVEHEVGDPEWAVRHVLQYAGEAELLGPADLRQRLTTAARRTARQHGARSHG